MIGCKTVRGGGKNDGKTDGLSIRGKREFSQKSCRNTGGCSGKEKMSARKGKITTVIIRDEAGNKAMKKPKGTYITIESPLMLHGDIDEREPFCSVSVNSWKV